MNMKCHYKVQMYLGQWSLYFGNSKNPYVFVRG